MKNLVSNNSPTHNSFITHTWNPSTGCFHNCVYCMARALAKRFALGQAYVDEHSKISYAKSNYMILVCDKADLFGMSTPDQWIINILKDIKEADSRITLIFLTKNPTRFHTYLSMFSENCLLGATIETNRDEGYEKYSDAPKPSERYKAMKSLTFPRKFISIEPIMDFDNDIFQRWMLDIAPERVVVGYESRSVEASKIEGRVVETKKMYCWNCKKIVKVVEGHIVPEIGDIAPDTTTVAYCSKCDAILDPEMITCYLCKVYSKTFFTVLMMHGGEMYHTLCRDCREVATEVKRRRFSV